MPAAMLGPEAPSVYRYRLGGFEITHFHDGGVVRDNPGNFAADQKRETVDAVLLANHLPTEAYRNSYTVVAVNTGEKVVLFDTGNGESRRRNGVGNLLTLMAVHGPKPEEVDVVMISHCHPDHIGGLIEAGKPAFPNAEVVFGRTEFDYWMRGENVSEQRKPTLELFRQVAAPLANQARFIEPGDKVAEGITAREAFGHSAGHLAFDVESEGERLLLWSDSASHYVLSLRHPEWQFAMDDDRERGTATRQLMLEMAAREGLLVAGYHMPFPGLGYVEREGDGYRWVPVGYQLSM